MPGFSLFEIVSIFLLIAAIQPVIQQHLLEAMRRRKIAELEKKRNSRVIVMVYRQETMRLLGFPILRFIDMNDSEAVLRAIHMTDPEVPIDIVLHTPGGLVLAATQIARAIKGHRGNVTVFVPHMAMSGGTLIALAADEIVMCEHSMLGPIDPQIDGLPAASLLKVTEQKPVAEIDDRTLVLADIARKAIKQMEDAATELLIEHIPRERALEIAKTLAGGTWTHDYPILPAEAQRLGLRVTLNMPKEVLELMTLYPQPTRVHPSVEYLPTRRERPAPQPLPTRQG
jgi:ClpP class serine protease